ncbi:MAG: COP23 domain-containing protein [Cyanobacteria bacterium SID2]|nr:COP23 domain-containing protein [Cyanobacteria bacterium SID2]MBP0002179.1 COP23 domain-containing protein [Cyanobacteria bacterium SBC]
MKKLFRWAIAGFAAAQLPLLFAKPSVAQPAASFECRTTDGIHFTVAMSRSGQTSDPIIVWTSDAFSSSGYPPARRCQEVTERLNDLLSRNGSSLSGLYLTVGRVNGQSVICSVNGTRGGCNSNNVLFTLSGDNGRNPEQVLYNLSSRATGTTIQESGGVPYVNLEQLVNQHF